MSENVDSAKTSRKRALPKKVLTELRAMTANAKPGEFIGTEDDLIRKLGVSRPTFRSAAAIAVNEKSLSVKHGPGGGYFSCELSTESISHMVAIYLQSRGTTLLEVLRAVEAVRLQIIRAAASERDEGLKASWRSFAAADRARERAGRFKEFKASEAEFGRQLDETCKNEVLRLYHSVLYDFNSSIKIRDSVFYNQSERIRQYWKQRTRVVETIIAGEAEIAETLARRNTKMVTEWALKDQANRAQDSKFDTSDFLTEFVTNG